MITIMKKEFARFFGDKRMVFSTVLLPGLMIYVLYSFMGSAMADQFLTAEDHVYGIHTVNLPDSLTSLKSQEGMTVTEEELSDVEALKAEIAAQETELLVIFPEGFDEKVASYDSLTAQGPAPLVEIYYNSVFTESGTAYDRICGILEQYETSMANKFDVNADTAVRYDLATERDMTGQFFSMLLPMLLMSFLFSACLSIAPESIAGEKERGTIATLLVTPVKRSELAAGKILSLSVIGLLGGVSSFIGTMLAIPKMLGGATGGGMDAGVYSGLDYLMTLLVILSTVLVIIGVIAILSGLAKSVKEAGALATPLMIVVMVVGVTSMFGEGAPSATYLYLIPFYNSVQCLNGIFSFSALPVNLAVTIGCNVVYTILMAAVLAKIFDSEKIMYI